MRDERVNLGFKLGWNVEIHFKSVASQRRGGKKGGTRVPRVVSGVAPETNAQQPSRVILRRISIVRAPWQSGGTPN
jgi:hypothetical protein